MKVYILIGLISMVIIIALYSYRNELFSTEPRKPSPSLRTDLGYTLDDVRNQVKSINTFMQT